MRPCGERGRGREREKGGRSPPLEGGLTHAPKGYINEATEDDVVRTLSGLRYCLLTDKVPKRPTR